MTLADERNLVAAWSAGAQHVHRTTIPSASDDSIAPQRHAPEKAIPCFDSN